MGIYSREEIIKKITFKSYKSNKRDPHTIQLIGNADGMKGMSGGPVMVQGKVIGILKKGGINLFYATKSDALISLLERPFINKDFNALTLRVIKRKQMLSNWLEFYREEFYLNIVRFYIKMGKGDESLKIIEEKFDDISMDYRLANLFFQKGDVQTGMEILNHLPKKGINQASWEIGAILFEEGHEWSKVKRKFKIAALRGFGPSSYVMGMDAEAEGLLKEAEDWFIKSFYQGYLPAYFKLEDFYKVYNPEELHDHYKRAYFISDQLLEIYNKYNKIKEAQKQVVDSTENEKEKQSLCLRAFLKHNL